MPASLRALPICALSTLIITIPFWQLENFFAFAFWTVLQLQFGIIICDFQGWQSRKKKRKKYTFQHKVDCSNGQVIYTDKGLPAKFAERTLDPQIGRQADSCFKCILVKTSWRNSWKCDSSLLALKCELYNSNNNNIIIIKCGGY